MVIKPSRKKDFDEYVSLDLETTGLNARKNEIIEIGIVKVKNKKAVEKMEVLIRPRKGPISAMITRLTGISNEMVQEAPDIDDVTPWIWDFIGDLPIIGYNIRFDLSFLQVHAPKDGQVTYVDVYPRCKRKHPGQPHCRLTDMTRLYKLHRNTHRAFDDAYATAQLYEISKKW